MKPMKKPSQKDLVVGLDIGTSKVLAIVAEVDAGGGLEVIGIGHHPTRGLRGGVIADIEKTVHSIQCAVEDAELMANCDIDSVFVGIAGEHINSLNSHGVVAVRDAEVGVADIEMAMNAAKAMSMPNDQHILHVLPQQFIIDGQAGIREPIGMCGVRMEAEVHIITCANSAERNIRKCVRRCGLEVDSVILEQLASSASVLSEDERELGVCLIDIGGGTADIAVFCGGAISHSAVIPIAGDKVTHDIAIAFHTPTQHAEEMKKRHGCALTQAVDSHQMIETPSMGDNPARTLSRRHLAEVIERRLSGLFGQVRDELHGCGLENSLGAGVVVTGGSSRIDGIDQLAHEIFNLPARLGVPNYHGAQGETVRNPIYATGLGLAQFGHAERRRLLSQHPRRARIVTSLVERVREWLYGSF